MPNQGPRSECNHCNNNMLATHKHNASALFWYTQRYHAPTRGYLAQSTQTKGRAPRTLGDDPQKALTSEEIQIIPVPPEKESTLFKAVS